MDGASDEGRMRRITEDTWNEFLPKRETRASYLLKMDVPVYFMVGAGRHFVCRYPRAVPPIDSATREKFGEISWVTATTEDLNAIRFYGTSLHVGPAYLRLSNASLDDLALFGSCKPHFAGCGWVSKGVRVDNGSPTTNAEEEIRTVSDLKMVEFGEAVLIDKQAWDWASDTAKREGDIDPETLRDKVEVEWKDLLLDTNDVARLKKELYARQEHVPCKFVDRECMPGIYWMFQAAYLLNHLGVIEGGKGGVGKWLTTPDRERFYAGRSVRTAAKFVWKELDRRRGRKAREMFNLNKINALLGDGKRAEYEVEFISSGLSMLLAIVSWWVDIRGRDSSASTVDLAKKLIVHDFGGAEVDDLVYLISGERIDDGDEVALKEWAKQSKRKWRIVRNAEGKKVAKKKVVTK